MTTYQPATLTCHTPEGAVLSLPGIIRAWPRDPRERTTVTHRFRGVPASDRLPVIEWVAWGDRTFKVCRRNGYPRGHRVTLDLAEVTPPQ